MPASESTAVFSRPGGEAPNTGNRRRSRFPQAHWRKIWSTNPLERLNGEIKRRTNVVGIFPNDAAVARLVTAVVLETDGGRLPRAYLSEESMTKLSTPEEQEAPLAISA